MTERAANKITDNKMIKKKQKTFKLLQFQHNKKKITQKANIWALHTLCIYREIYTIYVLNIYKLNLHLKKSY